MSRPIPLGPVVQVAFVVDDIAAACSTYGEAHTGTDWSRYRYDADLLAERTFRGRPGDFSMYLAMGGSHPQIELIQPLEGESLYSEHLRDHGPGVHHLGVAIDDMEATVRAMADAGFEVVMSGGGHGVDGDGAFAYFDTYDVAGIYYEAFVPPMTRQEPLPHFPHEHH